ncbi:MAG: Spy/CpxP family protein refolding chaperone [Cyanobacteria bacterium Co-bin13]|nr:Spy/CpxP family protein refolding chaperone [Cyanobacteria bacterium Co-bin13]
MKPTSRNVVLGAIALCLFSTAGYFTTANAAPTAANRPESLLDLFMTDRSGNRQSGRGGKFRPGKGGNPEQVFEQLDLSEAQLSQIRTIRESSRTTMQPLREQMRAGHQELRSLMAGNASTDELRQRHSTLMNLEQQLRAERFEVMLQIREVLTPQQRTELGELLEQRRSQQRQGNSRPNRASQGPTS